MQSLLAGFEFILRGGFMMYPLLLSALVALTVIIERLLLFQRTYKTSPEFISKVLQQVRAQQFIPAQDACKNLKTPVASVLYAGIENFNHPLEEMELSMKNQAEAWVPLLEKRIDVIDTVITAAPLMGLLGTITGMMASFEILSEKGINEPHAITGGVAEALIATATGLMIALVCLVFYNYLSTRVKTYIYDVESIASRMVEIRLACQRETKEIRKKDKVSG